MPDQAKTHRRKRVRRRIRPTRDAQAREAIGELEPGCEIFILTYGQFSLIDALVEITRQTGPADVAMSTWSAAEADLDRAKALISAARVRSMRLIVDRSFLTRKPDWCRLMVELFGRDSIRSTRTHAKWAVIRNEKWNIVLRTSMNLNANPRIENLEISDDPDFADFLGCVADELFRDLPPAKFSSDSTPMLPGVPWMETVGAPTAGKIETSDLDQPTVGQAP